MTQETNIELMKQCQYQNICMCDHKTFIACQARLTGHKLIWYGSGSFWKVRVSKDLHCLEDLSQSGSLSVIFITSASSIVVAVKQTLGRETRMLPIAS